MGNGWGFRRGLGTIIVLSEHISCQLVRQWATLIFTSYQGHRQHIQRDIPKNSPGCGYGNTSENRRGQMLSFGASRLIQLSHRRSHRQLSHFQNTSLHLPCTHLPLHAVGFVCSPFPRLEWWWQGLGTQPKFRAPEQSLKTKPVTHFCPPPHSPVL